VKLGYKSEQAVSLAIRRHEARAEKERALKGLRQLLRDRGISPP
jgi:hypothetical protein